jgi:hypothetical protein
MISPKVASFALMSIGVARSALSVDLTNQTPNQMTSITFEFDLFGIEIILTLNF